MKKNWSYVLLAIMLSVFSWFLVTGREKVEVLADMSLVMTNPPEGLIIESGLPDQIKVRVRGSKGLVRSLVDKTLTYPLDVSGLAVGETVVEIREDAVPLSSAYEIVEIKPNRLVLKVDRIARKDIAVEGAWKGNINPDYELVGAVTVPEVVRVKGPETVLKKITRTKVTVDEDFLDEVPANWKHEQALDLPPDVEATPGQVSVELRFAPKMREIWVKIPLTVIAPEGKRVKTKQDYVRLLLDGPVYLFRDQEFRKDMAAEITVAAGQPVGTYDYDYMVRLPEGCRLKRKNPERIRTEIR
ncbi:CdaR family protein [Salidesulfovibrio onnuriiensis]|uniref:CdaR family protein n=1 Tax=Salidesulfovibrio onnuriiensis TaxID=2583823 RepID=UPI0011C71F9C|nr:CdaR family protein [Salidesulfovibrio onnuriiensis]